MKTGLITSDTYQNHNTGDGHPEQIARVSVILENFKKINNKNLIWKKPAPVEMKLLEKTHTSDYINFIQNSFPEKGLSFLDGDTVIGPNSKDAIFDAAGSVIAAVDGVENKEFRNAFCAIRPPGHHCLKDKAMGFCVINNLCVAVNYLINKYGYKKIACLDWDCHWGNGSYDILKSNKNIFFASLHQYPFYPGGGTEDQKGEHNNALNIPLPAGTNSRQYLDAYEHVLKKLKAFRPEFILMSAGFDAHKDDPLCQMMLNSKDYYEITRRTLESTKEFCNGKVVSVLEGGYDLNALQESAEMHVNALLEFN